MNKLINKPTDVWEDRLNELFATKEKTAEEQFLDIVSIIIYENDNKDLSSLFSTLDFDTFIKVIDLFDGRTVTFPTKDEIKDAIEIALYFYHKEIKGVTSYDELKSFGISDKEFSSRSIGRKINSLKRTIADSVCSALKDIKK